MSKSRPSSGAALRSRPKLTTKRTRAFGSPPSRGGAARGEGGPTGEGSRVFPDPQVSAHAPARKTHRIERSAPRSIILVIPRREGPHHGRPLGAGRPIDRLSGNPGY